VDAPHNDNRPVVKIGAMFSLTGNMAEVGISASKALAKAIEDENSNPRNRLHYELIVEDDQMNSYRANNIARKFIDVDRVDVMVGSYNILSNGQFETPLVLYKIENGKAVVVKE
jgi:ABC-type branched-subunit amino acid transport system substrate-binding protein